MTKAELLSKLDEKALRNVAKNESLVVPNSYRKRELVKFLEGTLTLQKIKEYTAEVYEKETKRTIIHETIKEKGVRIKNKEISQITFNKLEVISELTNKERVHNLVLEELARNLKQPPPQGKGFNSYNKMSEKMLGFLDRIFVKKESDGHGLFLEYRTANFIEEKSKVKFDRLAIRHEFSNSDEIDVTGFNAKGKPVVIAECKDKKAKKEDIYKWIRNTKLRFEQNNGSLEESYFVTTEKITDNTYGSLEGFKEIDLDSGVFKIHNLLKGIIKNLGDEKNLASSRGVLLSVYEVRENQFVKVFPRKKRS